METQAWKELLPPLSPNNTTAGPLLTPGTQGPSAAASFTSMDSAPSLFLHSTGLTRGFPWVRETSGAQATDPF